MPDLQDRLQAGLADRYRIEREIGRGGMATVYLAQDLKHRRPVAVKILHPHLAANLGPERFQREVQIAARLSHPHILPLHDSGEADGFVYYVMPYVPGESLRGRLAREGQLPLEDALQITRHVAGALGYAHSQGVVHRDIKPENVMLHEGEPMVTDFGIAKAVSAASGDTLTQTGTAVGTPAYMSPEQASGDQELDGRSDIYSLGCMLYEMLAGEPPFTGPNAQAIIVKRFTEPVPSLRAARTGVPEAIERAVTRALARSPADRFPTVAGLVQALAPPYDFTRQGTGLAVPAAAPPVRSIAVLPFADMSPDRDQEYFADGIAEEIINALTKVEALRVASRTSAFAFKGRNEDIGEIGQKLKVGTVLEGSVRKAGNRLRVTAQLVTVADGYHLWSERYDRELEDVFAIQDEIAENIVRALRVVLSEDEKRAIEKKRTDNVQAYEYYLRGRQFFHQWRKRSVEYARRMFERAIEIDPNYALAYAGIADCCSYIYTYWDESAAHLEQADTATRKALELVPELAEAHASRGLTLAYSKRYDESDKAFETAIRLNPNLFEAHYFYGRARVQQGKLTEAAQSFAEAWRVRPEDYQAPIFLALAYDGLGRKAEAEMVNRQAMELLEGHLELNPDDSRALNLGAVELSKIGQPEKGLEWAKRALAINPEDSLMLYNTACFYAVRGQSEEALACLEQAVQNGLGHREWLANDPDFNSLRDHPRFQAVLRRI